MRSVSINVCVYNRELTMDTDPSCPVRYSWPQYDLTFGSSALSHSDPEVQRCL